MAGIVVADTLQAASTSTLVLKNGVANTPPTVQDSAGTQIGTFCRAWVSFNGTTVTSPASMTGVNGSFNISSILDNGTGNYTVNFTTAMPDTNYAVECQVSGATTGTGNGRDCLASQRDKAVGSYRQISTSPVSGSLTDPVIVDVAIFR